LTAAGYDVPVVLALDGQCFALAESVAGAAVGSETVLGVVISTGVGGGLIAHGRLVVGATANAGHFGQMEVMPYGETSGPQLLDDIASGLATVAWARQLGWHGRTGQDLALAYAEQDGVAVAAVRRSALTIGRALASVVALTDLDVVVIGGGFANVCFEYADLVRDGLREYAFFEHSSWSPFVVRSKLGVNAPLVGAACLYESRGH
jgi:glucokinase